MPGEPYPLFLPELWEEMQDLAKSCFWTPARLHKFFALMLRGHWSSSENHSSILTPDLGCLEWNPDPKIATLGVGITGDTKAHKKPHMLWVGLGNFQFKPSGFGNISGISGDNATITRTLSGSCQLKVSHDSPDMLLSYEMAFSSLCFLLGMTQSIYDAMGGEGTNFQPEIMGDAYRNREEPKETFRVDVGCRLDITLGVATTEESHKLAIVAQRKLTQ